MSELSDKLQTAWNQYNSLNFILESIKSKLTCCYDYMCPENGTESMQNVLNYMSEINSSLSDLKEAIKTLDQQLYMEQLQTMVDNMGDQPMMEMEMSASKNPDDYLVVEDKNLSTTWHLQVKRNGEYNRALCGAAWAALHEGFRGNKYEGPDKAKALKKLKAIYKKMGWDLPDSSK